MIFNDHMDFVPTLKIFKTDKGPDKIPFIDDMEGVRKEEKENDSTN